MKERFSSDREILIQECQILFKSFPDLEKLAIEYWHRIDGLPLIPASIETEKTIFSNTVISMVKVLQNTDIDGALQDSPVVYTDEKAIVLSIQMIEVVQDIQERNN